MPRLGLCALFVAVAAIAACDPDRSPSDDGGDGDGDDGAEELCGPASSYDAFVIGLAKTGAHATVSFADAKPAPPIRDFNTWTLRVEDEDGQPLDDVEWEIFPWMPDHGHGSPTPIAVGPGENPGEYVLDPVDLFMAGRWTIDLTLTLPEDLGVETVQFGFCIR